MSRRNSRYFTMVIHRHGILWWLLISFWWRPIRYFFWIFVCAATGWGLKKVVVDNRREK